MVSVNGRVFILESEPVFKTLMYLKHRGKVTYCVKICTHDSIYNDKIKSKMGKFL